MIKNVIGKSANAVDVEESIWPDDEDELAVFRNKGAAASAGIYTLIETAKVNGLTPMKYIKYILSDMPGSAFLEHPEYLDDYLPWNPVVKEICQ